MKKTKLTAFCGMMCALSVVLMLSTSILTVLVYTVPLFTGLIVYVVSLVGTKKWGLAVFFSTSVLSILLLTEKETALVYALFFGYYPLVKSLFENLPKILALFFKFFVFNCAAVLVGVVGVLIFGVPAEEYEEFGKFTIPVLLGLANVMFIMYDILLSKYAVLFSLTAEKIKKKFK